MKEQMFPQEIKSSEKIENKNEAEVFSEMAKDGKAKEVLLGVLAGMLACGAFGSGDADAAGLNKRAMELRAQQVLNQRADAGRTGECSIEKMPNGSTVYKIHKDGGAGAVFTTERDEQKKVFGPTVIKGPTSLK